MKSWVVLVLAMTAASPVATQPRDGWIRARTRHFDIVSNATEREVRSLASNLEQFVVVVSRILGTTAAPGVPVTVMAFRDDRSFRPFKPLYDGKPTNISGFFQRTRHATLIALDINASREGRPFAVIFHEYTHVLSGDAGRRWPAWLAEGLAEFYSTFEADGDRVTLGAPIAGHLYLLRQGLMMPLGQLFGVDRQSPIYNEGLRQNTFYAESWAFAHYLMLGNNTSRQPHLRQFIQSIGDGEPVEPAFRKVFTADDATLETELRGYISRRAFPVTTYRLTAPVGVSAIEVRPLSLAQGEWHLGNLLLQTDRLDEAEASFKRAMTLDEGDPGPYEGLGFLALHRNQSDVAAGYLEEAIARKSRNYLAHYTYADTLQRQLSGGALTPGAIQPILDSAGAAAALEPGFLPARHLLGWAYLSLKSDQAWSEGIRIMTEAHDAFPSDGRIAVMLAGLQARRREYDAAKTHLNAVLASRLTDDSLRTEARALLIQVEEAVMMQRIRVDPARSSEP